MANAERGIFKWNSDGKYYVINEDGTNDGVGYDTPEAARKAAGSSNIDWATVRDDGEVVDTVGGDDFDLEEELFRLEESTTRRQAEAKELRDADRVEGRERAEEVFSEGALGRVQEDTPDNILDLITERRSLSGEQYDTQAGRLGEMGATQDAIQSRQEEDVLKRQALTQSAAAGDVAETERRSAELQRVTQDFDELIKGRLNPNSKLSQGLREKGLLGIDQQYKQNIGQVRAAANAGNQKMMGALEADAMRAQINARRDLERDLIIENQSRAEALTSEAAQLRNLNVQQLEQLRNTQIGRNDSLQQAMEQLNLNQSAQRMQSQQQLADQTFGMTDRQSAEISRIEDMEAAIRQDQLQRQLLNLQSQSNELFGRLSTEEGIVNQGIAERTGVTQAVLAEAGVAENRRHQMETEEIQRIEANKPPPSAGGGGTVICTELNRQGILDDETYAADIEYSRRISIFTKIGYWLIAGPIVDRMPTSPLLTKVMSYPGLAWAREMAYRTGQRSTGSWLGKAMCTFGEPLCYGLGKMIAWLNPHMLSQKE